MTFLIHRRHRVSSHLPSPALPVHLHLHLRLLHLQPDLSPTCGRLSVHIPLPFLQPMIPVLLFLPLNQNSDTRRAHHPGLCRRNEEKVSNLSNVSFPKLVGKKTQSVSILDHTSPRARIDELSTLAR